MHYSTWNVLGTIIQFIHFIQCWRPIFNLILGTCRLGRWNSAFRSGFLAPNRRISMENPSTNSDFIWFVCAAVLSILSNNLIQRTAPDVWCKCDLLICTDAEASSVQKCVILTHSYCTCENENNSANIMRHYMRIHIHVIGLKKCQI